VAVEVMQHEAVVAPALLVDELGDAGAGGKAVVVKDGEAARREALPRLRLLLRVPQGPGRLRDRDHDRQ